MNNNGDRRRQAAAKTVARARRAHGERKAVLIGVVVIALLALVVVGRGAAGRLAPGRGAGCPAGRDRNRRARAAIGFTRMALGVHYLTDVVAGWLLGLVWLVITTVAFRRWGLSAPHRAPALSEGLAPEAAAALEPASRTHAHVLPHPWRGAAEHRVGRTPGSALRRGSAGQHRDSRPASAGLGPGPDAVGRRAPRPSAGHRQRDRRPLRQHPLGAHRGPGDRSALARPDP